MTPFSRLIASINSTPHLHTVTAPEDWRQGRTLYGGISAALCLEAVLRDFDGLPPLRSAQIAFVGPALGAAEIRTRLLRQGKSAAFVASDMESGGAVSTRALFCFGAVRAMASPVTALRAPMALPGPEDCDDFFSGPRRPTFAQHLDMRLASGPRPLSGAPSANLHFWARHCDPDATPGPVALFALADAAPPAAMSMITSVAAISSMTWTIDIVDPSQFHRAGWWLFQSRAETNTDGYSAQSMAIWTEQGDPVALGRQTVALFPDA